MGDIRVDFNKPYMTGKELFYIADAHFGRKLAGDGPYTMRCHAWLEESLNCRKALLTHSCTAALEMCALLLDIRPGDEIIMPSFTFVSTANAFVLRGGVPVFVDIREDTLNLDERLVEAAITPRTRAVMAVHYAGVGCEMDTLADIARRRDLALLEDAAQAMQATYRGQPLGTIGDLGALSFHETKNIISGEGGALLVNAPRFAQDAEIIREKGTDRSRFLRGEVDKYTWQSVGSSYLPGEITAAFLWAQLEEAELINATRRAAWTRYHEMLDLLEQRGVLRRPHIPAHCDHNAHLYYILLSPGIPRQPVLAQMREREIYAVFHYVPLHSSPGGRRYGRAHGDFSVTDSAAERLIRLPLWVGISPDEQEMVVGALAEALL